MQETHVRFLGWEGPLEKGTVTHSSILAWRIAWTEGPDGLQFIGLQRIIHDWAITLWLYMLLLLLLLLGRFSRVRLDSNNHFHYVKGLNKQKQINQLPTKLLRIKKKCISELSRQVLNCHAIPHWLQERVKIRIMQTITPHFKRSHYTRFSLPPSHSKCQGAEQGAKRLKYLCSSKAVG